MWGKVWEYILKKLPGFALPGRIVQWMSMVDNGDNDDNDSDNFTNVIQSFRSLVISFQVYEVISLQARNLSNRLVVLSIKGAK